MYYFFNILSIINIAIYSLIMIFYCNIVLNELESKSSYKYYKIGSIKIKWDHWAPIVIVHNLDIENILHIDRLLLALFKKELYMNDLTLKKHIWDYIPHSSQIINPNIKQNYKIESVNFLFNKNESKIVATNGLLFLVDHVNNKFNFELGDWKGYGAYRSNQMYASYTYQQEKGLFQLNIEPFLLKITDKSCNLLADQQNIKGLLNIKLNKFKDIFNLHGLEFLSINANFEANYDLDHLNLKTELIDTKKTLFKLFNLDCVVDLNHNFSDIGDILAACKGAAKLETKKLKAIEIKNDEFMHVTCPWFKTKLRADKKLIHIEDFKAKDDDLKSLSGWFSQLGDLDLKVRVAQWGKFYDWIIRGNYKNFDFNIKQIDNAKLIKDHGHGKCSYADGAVLLDLKDVEFEWYANLGVKPSNEQCVVKIDLNNQTVDIKNTQADAQLSWKTGDIRGLINVHNKYAKGRVNLNVGKGRVLVAGRADYVNAAPWLKEQATQDQESPKVEVRLNVANAQIRPGGFVRDANVIVKKSNKRFKLDLDAKFSKSEREKNKSADSRIYVSIYKPVVGQGKITVRAKYASKLAALFGAELPINDFMITPIVIQGVFSNNIIHGTAVINNLYTTKGLGLLQAMKFISLSSVLNYTLQLNQNQWPNVKVDWSFSPGNALNIRKIEMENQHYNLKLRGKVDLLKKEVRFDGLVSPKTLIYRFGVGLRKLLPGSVKFEIYGPFGDVKTSVKSNTVQILPLFIPL